MFNFSTNAFWFPTMPGIILFYQGKPQWKKQIKICALMEITFLEDHRDSKNVQCFYKGWQCNGENLKQGSAVIGCVGQSMKSISGEGMSHWESDMWATPTSQALGTVVQTEKWPSRFMLHVTYSIAHAVHEQTSVAAAE